MPRAQASCTALETPVKDAESWIRSSQQWLDKENFEASTEYIKKGYKTWTDTKGTLSGASLSFEGWAQWRILLANDTWIERIIQHVMNGLLQLVLTAKVIGLNYSQSFEGTARRGFGSPYSCPCLLPFIGKAIFSVLRSAWKKVPFKSTKTLFQGTV